MRGLIFVVPLAALTACHAEPAPAPVATHSPGTIAPTPMPSAKPMIDLSDYVGKYPPDKIGGIGFLDQPVVRKAVADTVPDPKIRGWILDKAGPQTPIALRGGKLLSWGCEAHNCGPHNWTVVVAPDGSNAEVCYIDMETIKQAVWYTAGKVEPRTDPCPSGNES